MEFQPETHERSAQWAVLREEHERLLALVNASPVALVAFRRLPNGRFCFPFVSASTVNLFGFTAEQLQRDAAPLLARIHPDDRSRFYETNALSAAADTPWRCEFRYQRDGSCERRIVGNSKPMRGPEGEITWSGMFFDITERRGTEDKLALAEAHLRSAFDAAEMGAWVFDVQRQKMWGNRNQRELWQTPPDAPEWFDIEVSNSQIHPEDRARAEAGLAAAIAGEPMRNEFRMIRADGAVRWIAARARAEPAENGGTRRVVGVNLDITQQKLSEEQALRSSKLESLGTLARGIAHDFNNVLSAILGNAQFALAVQPSGADTRPMLLEIEAAARRAADLVQQILTFSRPQERRFAVLDMAGPVREALKLVRATTSSLVALESQLDPSTPPIRADALSLIQLVLNLCTNAVHAIGKDRVGKVQVQLTPLEIDARSAVGPVQMPPGRYAQLLVSDDGCGMDDATLARIYDPFFSTKPPGEGTGLGLSVVHGIVRAVGGTIAATSRLGEGTRFQLCFPAADGTAGVCAAASEVEASTEITACGRGQRIMLVDDEPMVLRLASQQLQFLGFAPESYLAPERAAAAFAANPEAFALVLTDLAMPGLSGFELARSVLSVRNVPVVLMSGALGTDERMTAQQIGVRKTLDKPLDLAALRRVLSELC